MELSQHPGLLLPPHPNPSGVFMIRRLIGIATVAAAMALPVVTHAQGVPGGVERGSREGERAAGPLGAVVGGVIGGVVGGVSGVLGVDERPRFRSYVVEQRRPSYQYREDVRVGVVLPEEGVTYYDSPAGIWRTRAPVHGGEWPHGSGRTADTAHRRDRRIITEGRLRTALWIPTDQRRLLNF